jgi:hypothetical protein
LRGVRRNTKMLVSLFPLPFGTRLHSTFSNTFATLALGSRPRQGLARLQAKREAQESHHILLRVQWVQRVWGNEPSHCQMNSHCGSLSPKWTPESSEHNCKDQNPLV